MNEILAPGLCCTGVEQLDPKGETFDPQVHEAVLREESADVEVPTVVGEMQRGYRLHERLLRPALVRVAVPIEPGEGEPAESSVLANDSGERSGEGS